MAKVKEIRKRVYETKLTAEQQTEIDIVAQLWGFEAEDVLALIIQTQIKLLRGNLD